MATSLQCHARDSILARYTTQLAAIGAKANIAMRDTLNREGRAGRVKIRQALVRQTGLPARTIRKAVDPNTKPATAGRLEYKMTTYGGEISLKYFSPRETRSGVKHKSPKREGTIGGAFTKGGSFKKGRKAINNPVATGHVWMRSTNRSSRGIRGGAVQRTASSWDKASGGKWPVEKQDSGVIIPVEMVSGESRQHFTAISFRLSDTLGKQIARYLPK